MRYEIVHRTQYEYEHAVSISHHVARVTPRGGTRQRVLAHALEILPAALAVERADYFGNAACLFTIEGAHRTLSLTARSRVEVDAPTWPDPAATAPWEQMVAACRQPADAATLEASEFALPSPHVPWRAEFGAYAAMTFTPGRAVMQALLELMQRIHAGFTFDPKATTVTTPVEHVFRQRRGVCQDFAHLLIACLRVLGLPARYVSGYLETLPPPGQAKLVGTDASHAWAEVWCGDAGWLPLDPTNNLVPGDRHVTVAWGRDYGDVSPLRGVIVGGGGQQLKVAVDVRPQPELRPSAT